MATNHDDAPPPDDRETKAPPSAGKPARPAAGKSGAKPAGVRPAADRPTRASSSQKRVKPPPAETEEHKEPAEEKAEADVPESEEKTEAETGVQTEPPAKGKKKKAKAETGVTTKPGGSFFSFSKAPPAGVWGIDLGQCALKAVRLEVIDGEVTATAFDYIEHPKILSQPDADPDELTREALQKFLSRNTLRGDTVAISVPGQSGLARFVKLPPVEEKKIPDIVRFEAKQQIPFNLDEVVWDYQKLGANELAAGFVETEIGLFAMKRDMVNRYLQHFKEVGVEVHQVQMAPLALCNFVAYDLLGQDAPGAAAEEGDKPKKRCVTALDIGADSSNLVITDGGRIIWQRPIPLGGNHFTRALTKDLKLTFAKAEHLKRNAVKSPDLKKILAALKPVLSDFVGEVQRSLGYFTNTHRDAQIDYMVGLGNAFRLPGLQRYLAEKLQMDVRKLGKMERLTGDSVVASATYTENILSFAVAYGLALQGLRRTKLHTNLLPHEIRQERAVRGKKPWAVAAAALLMLGLGALGFSSFLSFQSYGAEVVGKAVDRAKSDAGTAQQKEDAFKTTKTAALNEEEAVKSIIAGQAERKNWLEFTRFLFTDALPDPDGSHLTPEAHAKYWDGQGKSMTGKQAFEEMQTRQKTGGAKDANGKPAGGDDLGPAVDDLVQVNIEYFDQRYTDDLGLAWQQVKQQNKVFDAENPNDLKQYVRSADPAKAPEGKGWLVEVHGYTYHTEANTFLANTLMDNIYRFSAKPGGPDAPASGTPTPPAAGNPAAGSPTPPAAGNPTPPAAGAPTAPGATTADPSAVAASGKDVYMGRISHVTLFAVNPGTRATIVGQSVLDSLVKASGGLGGVGGAQDVAGQTPMPTGNPMPMPGGSTGFGPGAPGGNNPAGPASRDSWRPLSTFIGTGAAAPGQSNMSPVETSKPKTPAAASGHTRTEFVVVFFWKEPAPSDKLRFGDETPKPATTSGPPGFPTAPGMPMPAGSMPTAQPPAAKPATARDLGDIGS